MIFSSRAFIPVLSLLLGGVLVSCSAPPASSGGFDSDNPASRLYAIQRAGQTREVSAVPDLVEQLDSDDPAIRMMAIHALQQITGKRLGYNPYDSTAERQPAIASWIAEVESGSYRRSGGQAIQAKSASGVQR